MCHAEHIISYIWTHLGFIPVDILVVAFILDEIIERKEKEAKKKQKIVDVKEVRLSPNIDTNDLNTKVNSAKKFIQKGDKVKVTLRFRGRELAHMQTSKHILDDFADMMKEVAVVEKPAKLEGRSISMVLTEKR
mgnify:CR=1 FL=1